MHPLVKVLSFILIIFLTNFVHSSLVWLLCFLTCVVVLYKSYNDFLLAVRRMRWLFISIFIIYAFGTPGEYIAYFSNNLAPTFEGVSLGILQVFKLLTAIAALIILFGTTTKVQLLSAFSQLLLPFKMLGFNTSRFVVRLLLTLNYVEAFTINEKVNISFDYLNSENLDKVENSPQQVVELPYSPLKLVDKAQVFIIACIFLTLLIPSISILISALSMMKFFS